jgi:hypothetical protein
MPLAKTRVAALFATVMVASMPATAQPQVPDASYFVGRWGKVSFNDDRDLGRMINMARSFCGSIPYVIRARGGDAFEMFVADTLRDVRVVQENGRLYIVPVVNNGGVNGARELTVRDRNVFTVRYLDPGIHSRYGANVFVRCGAGQREARPARQQGGANAQSTAPEQTGTIAPRQ